MQSCGVASNEDLASGIVQGEIMEEKLTVPRLRVRKDWYQNLDPDPTDHSHPDLGVNPDAQDGTKGLAYGTIALHLLHLLQLAAMCCHAESGNPALPWIQRARRLK